MEGMVLGVDAEGGVIRTAEGARYRFPRSQWKSPGEPAPGDRVDFVCQGEEALEVYLLQHRAPAIAEMIGGIEKSEKMVPTLVYMLYLGAVLWGVTMLIGVAIAYIFRDSSSQSWYESHYTYQIAIFWRSLLGFLAGILLVWFFALGVIIMLVTYVWVLVKIVKGWRCLAQGLPAPAF